MNQRQPQSDPPHLVWVCAESLIDKLHAATWLDTTHELREMDWRVTLIAAGPAGHQCVRGVEVRCIPKPQLYLIGQVAFHARLLRFLAEEWGTIDVILYHSTSAPWVLPLQLVRRLSGKRRPMLVMDTRTLHMIPESKESWKDRIRRPFHELMGRLANRWADGRLAISQRMAKSLHIPPDKLWGVWPSGVELGLFAPAQVARRWPCAEEPIHVIYIGCLHHERNLLTLSRAVKKANAEGMQFTLSLVGDGTERADLERFADQTAGQIRVMPPVPHDEVWKLLAQADIGVLPFPDEEKFQVSSPVKLFEYMAAGLPILATRIACHTDVVGDGEYVFWAEQADVPGLLAGLRLIWQDRECLSKMGSQASTAAEGWTWRASAEKLKRSLEYGLADCALSAEPVGDGCP